MDYKLDPSLEKYYSEGDEKSRLAALPLERDRTLQILKKWLPSPPATILDVGGAAGVYAFHLAEMGYQIHLIDPVPEHIAQAKEREKKERKKLSSCSVGDARKIDQKDESADAVLFLGPLYHLIERKDRMLALSEARRVLKPGALLFAAGISRFASLMDAMHKGVLYTKLKVIEEDLKDGIHRKISTGLTFGYLHRPSELKEELETSGFKNVSVRAIEGPVWEKRTVEALQHESEWEKLLQILEKIETEEEIVGASAHLMAIGSK